MSADKQASQHSVDDVVMTDDHTAQLFLHSLVSRRKLLGPLFDGFADAHESFTFCYQKNSCV